MGKEKVDSLLDQLLQIDYTLPEAERRVIACDIFLKMIKSMKGKDLEPYLSDITCEYTKGCTKIVLRFPDGVHIDNSLFCNRKGDRF